MIEYLDEIETEFDNTLACLSGAQMGSNRIMKKTGVQKSHDTLPLSQKSKGRKSHETVSVSCNF